MRGGALSAIVLGAWLACCGGSTTGVSANGSSDGGAVADASSTLTDAGGQNPKDGAGGDGGTTSVEDPATLTSHIDRASMASLQLEHMWIQAEGQRDIFGAHFSQIQAVFSAGVTDVVDGNIASRILWAGGDFGSQQSLTGAGVGHTTGTSGWIAGPPIQPGQKNFAPPVLATMTTGSSKTVRFRGATGSDGAFSIDSPRGNSDPAMTCPDGRSDDGACIMPGGAAFGIVNTFFNAIDPMGPNGQVAIDDVRATSGDYHHIVVAARLDGPGPFALGLVNAPDAGAPPSISGPAVLVAGFTDGVVAWSHVFSVGGVVPAIGAGVKDEPGFGCRLSDNSDVDPSLGFGLLMTAPFTGTMHVDKFGDLVAPAASYATATIALDGVTGEIALARAFAKGPGSVGKPSHASAVFTVVDQAKWSSAFEIAYTDTVWDSITFDSTHTALAKQGADAVVAILTSGGAVKKVRTYGGSGDDEPLGIGPARTSIGVTVFGRSNASIDIGTGPMAPSAGATQLWFGEFPTLH